VADAIERLQGRLEGCKSWPPPAESRLHRDMRLYRSLRLTDREHLAAHVNWNESPGDEDRRYLADPLAERIPGCWADMIFGEPATFTAANDSDQDALDALLAANAVPDELQEAVKIASSEREAWWRIVSDQDTDFPVIEWRSRLDTYPLMAGRSNLLAVAFVEKLDPPAGEENEKAVWRLVEYREEGRTVNVLYRCDTGAKTESGIGKPMGLEDHHETEDVAEEWNHALPALLAGYVRNGRGDRPTVGRSDYAGPLDLLLALNENLTIGQENARLSGKKRAIVPPDVLDAHGNFPSGADVFQMPATDGDPDDQTKGLIQIEWEFNAGPIIEWAENLADTALTRSRIAPQLVGRFTEGAQTGPALRARLLDSILCAEGKARAWQTAVPDVIAAAQLVDALPEEQGGYGHQWTEAGKAPGMNRKDSLPVDADEQTQRIVTEISGEILSRRTAIEERHPEWDEERVDKEIDLIAGDIAANAPEPAFAGK
jgi:Phage portal protein, SPP1 Gp6-like